MFKLIIKQTTGAMTEVLFDTIAEVAIAIQGMANNIRSVSAFEIKIID